VSDTLTAGDRYQDTDAQGPVAPAKMLACAHSKKTRDECMLGTLR